MFLYSQKKKKVKKKKTLEKIETVHLTALRLCRNINIITSNRVTLAFLKFLFVFCFSSFPKKVRPLYCSHIYRISLANALPNAILSKFALFARNSEAFGSICKHSEAFCENFESLRKLGTCS